MNAQMQHCQVTPPVRELKLHRADRGDSRTVGRNFCIPLCARGVPKISYPRTPPEQPGFAPVGSAVQCRLYAPRHEVRQRCAETCSCFCLLASLLLLGRPVRCLQLSALGPAEQRRTATARFAVINLATTLQVCCFCTTDI